MSGFHSASPDIAPISEVVDDPPEEMLVYPVFPAVYEIPCDDRNKRKHEHRELHYEKPAFRHVVRGDGPVDTGYDDGCTDYAVCDRAADLVYEG